MPSFSNLANSIGSLFGALALLGTLGASSARAEDFERTGPVKPGGTLRIELSSGSIEIVELDPEGLHAAWREFVRNADPRLSLCDAASFVVMRTRGITRALTLDQHFVEAGFEIVP